MIVLFIQVFRERLVGSRSCSDERFKSFAVAASSHIAVNAKADRVCKGGLYRQWAPRCKAGT